TLDELLGEQRADLAREIGNAIQADLQRLNSGVEILATITVARISTPLLSRCKSAWIALPISRARSARCSPNNS
ncbi:hypothetical protein QCD79_32925, partial [Pseudomonas quasicaspiana]|nr:hypothetical protein [Pseudomonas quasicaspiana]